MKRIAALSLTVASLIIMSNPTYASPLGGVGRFLREGAEKVKPAAEKIAVGGAMQVAQNTNDESAGGTFPVIESMVLAAIIFGIYRVIKSRS
jgi:hypothetical protein